MGKYIDAMLDAYVECALWSSTGEDERPLDDDYGPDDIAPEARASMRKDCVDFLDDVFDLDIDGLSASQVGHDFWLTRNRHGAGFWDRGLGELGEKLTERTRPYGESNLYVGDDGKVYVT